MTTWHLRSRNINEVVSAPDQFAAWATLRDRPVEDFGLLVSAEPDEDDDPIPVRTTALMYWWGRDADAAALAVVAAEAGLPDTTVEDRAFAADRV